MFEGIDRCSPENSTPSYWKSLPQFPNQETHATDNKIQRTEIIAHPFKYEQQISKGISSVAQSCPTICNPIDCSTPGFPVHHQLPELARTHPSSPWCHLTISSSVIPFSSCPQSFPVSGSFPMSQFITSGGQSIGASASASVLPMIIQDWFPLGLTSLISLLSSKDLFYDWAICHKGNSAGYGSTGMYLLRED